MQNQKEKVLRGGNFCGGFGSSRCASRVRCCPWILARYPGFRVCRGVRTKETQKELLESLKESVI